MGYYHSGAVVDNKLYMWGINYNGQLGLGNSGSETNINTPQPVTYPSFLSGNITDLSFGGDHSAAVVNNTLYTWGINEHGQLGQANNTNQNTPTLTPLNYILNIDLNSTNDTANVRDKIAYNVTTKELTDLIEQSRNEIGLFSTNSFTINSIQDIGSYQQTNLGQKIILIASSSKEKYTITFNGFKSVKEQQI